MNVTSYYFTDLRRLFHSGGLQASDGLVQSRGQGDADGGLQGDGLALQAGDDKEGRGRL